VSCAPRPVEESVLNVLGSLRVLITTGKGDPYRANGGFRSETVKHQSVNKATDV
jgi:hypothetical protein